MKRRYAIELKIAERWGGDPIAKICKQILEFVASHPNQSQVMLNYSDLLKITGKRYTSEALQRALSILISRFSALQLGIVFFDEAGDPHYLDDEAKIEFVENGLLAHPETGQLIDDASDKAYPYYLANPADLLEEVD